MRYWDSYNKIVWAVCCLYVCNVFGVILSVSPHSVDSDTCEKFRGIYQEVCSVPAPPPRIHSQGVPGKRGVQGEKGEKGSVGMKGETAEVDYGIVRQEIKGMVNDDLTEMKKTLKKMQDDLRNTTQILEGFCPVFYQNKCFKLIIHSFHQHNLKYPGAEEKCRNIGWSIGNIYDGQHYYRIAEYARTSAAKVRGSSYFGIWIGMTWDIQNSRAVYPDGSTRRQNDFPVWHPGYPSSSSSYTQMGIAVRIDRSNVNIGVHNWSPTNNRHAVLCELPIQQ